MTVDAEVLLANLPGLYRDQDVTGDLRRFLALLAGPLGELHASITQLRDDQAIDTCRPPFIPLLGALVGAEVDATLPDRAQRDQVRDAISRYREKGTPDLLRSFAETVTGWRVTLVDYSTRVATTPHLPTVNPVQRRQDQPVAERPPGSGAFTFRPDATAGPLFDALTGRPITRAALAGRERDYAGVPGRFTITRSGVDLFTGPVPWTALAADLTDPANPRTPAGAPLPIGERQVAVDPVLGRFRIVHPLPLAADLRVTFHALAPGRIAAQTASIVSPTVLATLGRSDDVVPAVLDLRAPRAVTDATGRNHFDNLGFFVTPARIAVDRRPNALPPGSGRLTFDDRPLDPADTQGVRLQLLNGLDGAPLTRSTLDGAEARYSGEPDGFSIRVGGVDVTDPAFRPAVRVRAADLTDFTTPRRPGGDPLALESTDIAVDPQLGRLLLDPVALDLAARDIRVDYLTAPATRVADGVADALAPDRPEARVLSVDGVAVEIVDGFDGTAVRTALRLGTPAAALHGTARGWTVRRNGADVTAQLTPLVTELPDPVPAAPAGTLAVDPERGRLVFPPGFLTATDRVTVSFSHPDRAGRARRFDSLAQHLPDVVPAGIVPVAVDTRRRTVKR